MKTRTITQIAVPAALLVLVAMTIGGCVSSTVHFRRMLSASKPFEQHQVMPGHQYHYFGRPHAPVAIVAIRDGYRLASDNWTPIDMDEPALKDMVERMLNQSGAEYNMDPNGAQIFNDNGDIIGLWYSVWQLPVLRFTAEKEFTISDPMTIFPNNNRESDNDDNYVD